MARFIKSTLIGLSLASVAQLLSATPEPRPAESLLDDLHVLKEVLREHGGLRLGGSLRELEKSPSDGDDGNCTAWSYDNTTIFSNGKFRHEHSYQGKSSGFYGERFVENPYVVHYVSGPLGTLRSTRFENCIVHEWGVVECNNNTKTHYVFHDKPQMGCQDVPQNITQPTHLPGGALLEEQVGVWPPEVTKNLTSSDLRVLPLLEFYGGAPGLVTASRVRPYYNVSVEDADDEARDEWLYEYRLSNVSSALRFEHAFLRSDDVGDLYEDFHGYMYWRSANGDYFIRYRQNNTGFYSDAQRAKIAVYRSLWTVTLPLPLAKD